MRYDTTMKTKQPKMIQFITSLGALSLLLAGCATQQNASYEPQPEPAPTRTVQAPAPSPTSGFGPSHSSFESGGVVYTRGSMAFPTGRLESSGLLLEKTVPAEVMVGQTFTYVYKVTNLTDFPIHMVQVTDRVTSNFRASDASPQPDSVSNGVATWSFDSLGGRESREIRVTGSANAEGIITICGWAIYSPILCDPIRVVQADMQLVKSAPSEVLLCDPIPVTFEVTNTGSSVLRDVVVTDTLPAGMTAVNGGTSLRFEAGTLNPGQSRTFSATLQANNTGSYQNMARATSAQGVEAEDSMTTVVRQPVLSIACDAPDERFAGRPANFCFTVTNTGDAVSQNTVITTPVPAGAVFQGATSGGTLSGNMVVWNVGALAPDASKEVCVTFTLEQPGDIRVTGTAQGTCATAVSTSCSTLVSGIPAILLEVIDLEDPIEVGNNVRYEIIVTNQGSSPATNVELVCRLEDSQEYISGSGVTSVSSQDRVITMAPVPSIAPQAQAKWVVTVKALTPGDVRFSVSMNSDQLGRPVEETEATNQY